jgi:hypothetical protein
MLRERSLTGAVLDVSVNIFWDPRESWRGGSPDFGARHCARPKIVGPGAWSVDRLGRSLGRQGEEADLVVDLERLACFLAGDRIAQPQPAIPGVAGGFKFHLGIIAVEFEAHLALRLDIDQLMRIGAALD